MWEKAGRGSERTYSPRDAPSKAIAGPANLRTEPRNLAPRINSTSSSLRLVNWRQGHESSRHQHAPKGSKKQRFCRELFLLQGGNLRYAFTSPSKPSWDTCNAWPGDLMPNVTRTRLSAIAFLMVDCRGFRLLGVCCQRAQPSQSRPPRRPPSPGFTTALRLHAKGPIKFKLTITQPEPSESLRACSRCTRPKAPTRSHTPVTSRDTFFRIENSHWQPSERASGPPNGVGVSEIWNERPVRSRRRQRCRADFGPDAELSQPEVRGHSRCD